MSALFDSDHFTSGRRVFATGRHSSTPRARYVLLTCATSAPMPFSTHLLNRIMLRASAYITFASQLEHCLIVDNAIQHRRAFVPYQVSVLVLVPRPFRRYKTIRSNRVIFATKATNLHNLRVVGGLRKSKQHADAKRELHRLALLIRPLMLFRKASHAILWYSLVALPNSAASFCICASLNGGMYTPPVLPVIVAG